MPGGPVETGACSVGNIEEGFLAGEPYTKPPSSTRMTIEQDGDNLLIDGRHEAVLEDDEIVVTSEQAAGWIADCDSILLDPVNGCLYSYLWYNHSLTVVDDGPTILIEEFYEANADTTVGTHEWNRYVPT